MVSSVSRRADELLDGTGVPPPIGESISQSLPPLGREPIELCFAIVLGDAPSRCEEVVVLETIERLVQGRVDDGDLTLRLLVDEHGYAVSVHRPPRECLEHE